MKNQQDDLEKMRHSAAHILAAAVADLLPKVKLGIGPVIENGFYYDFDLPDKLSLEDLPKIERKMSELIKKNLKFECLSFSLSDARSLLKEKNQPYKIELVKDLEKEGKKQATFYKSGDFIDLCAGPHIESSKQIGSFKLLNIAGAYWRGSEKNPMMQRIYGTAWQSQEELDKYLYQIEEAKKRDHRKLGKELDLFTFSDLVGKGLPLFTPKGTILRNLLNEFSQKLRLEKGFQMVWIPHIANISLYKVSGHWDKFGDELFLVKSQETGDQLVLKPMNCPHHQQIYASRIHSYKELPIKYLETTTIYRDEKAGELSGISRVRSATQDDSHVFCTPEQIEEVYNELIEVTKKFYDTLGMTYRARLSFRDPNKPEKYLGEDKLWKMAEDVLLKIAKDNKLEFFVAVGEAAFYGPKIDFMVTDALGREQQLATPQLDFVQPQRFGLTYIDENGKEKTPVMIHFALMGSIERFLAAYIEHTAGAFPVWVAPTQAMLIPIAERHLEYCERTREQLSKSLIRVELDERNETMQAKIRDAQLQKMPYMLIVGDKEVAQKGVAVRTREGKDLGLLKVEEFEKRILEETSTYK